MEMTALLYYFVNIPTLFWTLRSSLFGGTASSTHHFAEDSKKLEILFCVSRPFLNVLPFKEGWIVKEHLLDLLFMLKYFKTLCRYHGLLLCDDTRRLIDWKCHVNLIIAMLYSSPVPWPSKAAASLQCPFLLKKCLYFHIDFLSTLQVAEINSSGPPYNYQFRDHN